MLAKDIMTKDVAFVKSDATLRDVARLLIEKSISAAPVLEGEKPVGMISEGDLAAANELRRNARAQWWLAQLAEGEPLDEKFLAAARSDNRCVRELMSHPVISVAETADIEEVARLMEAHKIKRVLVCEDGRMVGIVTRADIVRAVAAEQEGAFRTPPVTEQGRVIAAD